MALAPPEECSEWNCVAWLGSWAVVVYEWPLLPTVNVPLASEPACCLSWDGFHHMNWSPSTLLKPVGMLHASLVCQTGCLSGCSGSKWPLLPTVNVPLGSLPWVRPPAKPLWVYRRGGHSVMPRAFSGADLKWVSLLPECWLLLYVALSLSSSGPLGVALLACACLDLPSLR